MTPRWAWTRGGLVGLGTSIVVSIAACAEEPIDQASWTRPDAEPDAGAPTTEADAAIPLDGDAPTNDASVDDGGFDASVTTSPLKVVVLSDLNGSYGSTTYEASVHRAVDAIVTREKPNVVLISGDMVAGQKSGLDYAAMWKGFHDAVTNKLVAAGIPVAPAPGNHDASAYDGFQGERAEYQRQWKPARVPAVTMIDGAEFPFRYSFTVGGAFFVALDATTNGPLSGAQRTWVKHQLEAASPYAVRIVYGHVPIHPTTIGRETEVLGDGDFEDVLRTHGAIFVGGHHHGYYPGVANGVRHVVTPCAGSGPRALIGTSTTSARGYVVIDIVKGKVASIEARTGTDYTSFVPRSTLPTEIRSGPHLLTRDDLAGF